MYCIVCGNSFSEGEEICSNCGAPVKRKKKKTAPTPFFPQQPIQPQPVVQPQQLVTQPQPQPEVQTQAQTEVQAQPEAQPQPEAQTVQPQPEMAQPQPQPWQAGQQQFIPQPQPQQYIPQPQFRPYPNAGVPPYMPVQGQPAKKGMPWYAWALIVLSVLVMLSPMFAVFVPSFMTYTQKSAIATANRNASTACEMLMVYAQEHGDTSDNYIFTAYDLAARGTIDCEASKDEGGLVGGIASELCANHGGKSPGYIIVVIDQRSPKGYFVQWREKDNSRSVIGQCPTNADWHDYKKHKPVWGEYYSGYGYYGY